MKTNFMRLTILLLVSNIAWAAPAGMSAAKDSLKKTTESQIRRLIDPILEKYCRDQCKLLSIGVQVEASEPEETAPGFDEIPVITPDSLAPTGAKIKVLVDDRVGPSSRSRLSDLMQRYLETLDYPVSIDMQLARFPQPAGTEGRVADLREKISKNFQNTINDLIQQFCPEHCLFTDFELKTEIASPDDVQFGASGEFVQDGEVALKIKSISGMLLIDESVNPTERKNIFELAKFKTSSFKNVDLATKTLPFPHRESSEKTVTPSLTTTTMTPAAAVNSGAGAERTQNRSDTSENHASSTNDSVRQEKFERLEKIERVENGDAVQKELQNFKLYALIFGCSILSLLVFIAFPHFRPRSSSSQETASGFQPASPEPASPSQSNEALVRRMEIQRLIHELMEVFVLHPRVAKHVFSRILTEEGIETTAQYVHLLGESVVVDILRDPSLQTDMNELMDYYARTTIELKDEEKIALLKKLQSRTVAGKLAVTGNRSSNLFEFLAEMDAMQVFELIRDESLTVKSIVLTQCDAQKRSAIYTHLDEETRMKLLTELSRIDYLPREFVGNVSNALKRKREESPRFNTESLPGSEVLVSLLERTGTHLQRDVMKNLETSSPESARNVKGKLISIETLRYLRDGQLLEVVLSLKHDELLQFLKGAPALIRESVFAKAPRELVIELKDELESTPDVHREAYFSVERKILNRMKVMANDGLINLVETNERMFAA